MPHDTTSWFSQMQVRNPCTISKASGATSRSCLLGAAGGMREGHVDEVQTARPHEVAHERGALDVGEPHAAPHQGRRAPGIAAPALVLQNLIHGLHAQPVRRVRQPLLVAGDVARSRADRGEAGVALQECAISEHLVVGAPWVVEAEVLVLQRLLDLVHQQ